MADGADINKTDKHSDPDRLSDVDLDELDDDFDLAGYREERIEELKRRMEHNRDLREIDHGKYTEIFDEKEVIRTSAYEKRCVIHFYHRGFQRCKIMDKHLEEIAPKYFETRFLRVFVENVPWLVEKLSIKVLPCVIVFLDGVTKDRIVGFEELGNADDFETGALELRLKVSGQKMDELNPSVTGVIAQAISQPPLRSMYAADDDDTPKSKIRNSSWKKNDDDDVFDL